MQLASHNRRPSPRSGMTLMEVMIAAFVLAAAMLATIAALQKSFDMIGAARDMTLAGQIIQGEIESARLYSFSRLPPSGSITLSKEITDMGQGFAAARTVTDVSSYTDEKGVCSMKKVELTVSWRDHAGRNRQRKYTTYYAKGGLSDYFVTNRPTISQ